MIHVGLLDVLNWNARTEKRKKKKKALRKKKIDLEVVTKRTVMLLKSLRLRRHPRTRRIAIRKLNVERRKRMDCTKLSV